MTHRVQVRDYLESQFGTVEKHLEMMTPEALGLAESDELFKQHKDGFVKPVLKIDTDRQDTADGIRGEASGESFSVIACLTADSSVALLRNVRLVPANCRLGFDFTDIRFDPNKKEMSLSVAREKSQIESATSFLIRYAEDLTADVERHYREWEQRLRGMIQIWKQRAAETLARRQKVNESLGIPIVELPEKQRSPGVRR